MKYFALIMVLSLSLAACGERGPEAPDATSTEVVASVTASVEPATAVPTLVPTDVPPTEVPPTATTLPATAVPPTATSVSPTPVPTQPPVSGLAEEILFLRGNALWTHEVRTGKERRIVEEVADFVVGPAAMQIALLRGIGTQSEIWLVARDGSGLRQITKNNRAEASLSWSPDAAALVYASSTSTVPFERTWPILPGWCSLAEVRAVDLATGTETSLVAGCEPVVSPDGKRIAYTAPPTQPLPGASTNDVQVVNNLRLINRLAQNGWNFAKAQGQPIDTDGMFVYGAAWSPDGKQLSYSRYLGSQVETDLNLSEIGGSFEGKGKPFDLGFGVMLPAQFAPNGRTVAMVSYDAGNAAGWEGYGAWRVQLVDMVGTRDIAMPNGPLVVLGQDGGQLMGGQMVAWSPDATTLAVQLPVGWKPDTDPSVWGKNAGEIRRWVLGQDPSEVLVRDVDYASPVAWVGGR